MRPEGKRPVNRQLRFGQEYAHDSPGLTQLTLIPKGLRTPAMSRESCVSAALDWAYENSQQPLRTIRT